jgi:hypothetical protein
MVAIDINGTIKTYPNIPDTWKNQATNETTLGYNYLDASIHYIDGFRDVVEPQYNSTTSYKGSMIYDSVNNVFTYEVIDFTVEQLAANLLIVEETEDKSDIEKLVNRGGNLVTRTKERLVRRRKKGTITKARTKTVREILHPIFLLLNTGDIDIANDKAILIPINSNNSIETELVWFKAELQNLLLDVNNLL